MSYFRTRIKICGTTNLEDAEAAVAAGADALGFIFVQASPRAISVRQAADIIRRLPPFVDAVGVFVDRELKEVFEIVRETGLSCIQLHGSEEPDYCRQAARMTAPCRVLKAFRIGVQSRATDFTPFSETVSGFLLDTYVKGQAGGTGEIFDWQIIGKLGLRRPVILAGGLRPENIVEAIRTVRPYAVDVNSGVERSPGIKDHDRLRELIGRVRLADGDPAV